MSGIRISAYKETDWPDVWLVLKSVFEDGTTYPYPADTDEAAARRIWLEDKTDVFVVRDRENDTFLGTYYLKPNQPGRGAHVCNCGYITSPAARGSGVATQMCKHSQGMAIRHGFSAMQFNYVVASNTGAVRLWQKLGFEIVGTLPGVFDHPQLGLVDAHVMIKSLQASDNAN